MKRPSAKKKIRVEISAGGVVFQRTRSGPRLAMILDPFHKWTFPKGHVEAGETPARAAERETREEIGVGKLRLHAPLGTMDFWFRRDPVLIHKFVHYFLFEAPRGTVVRPEPGELIRAVQWVSPREARGRSGYQNMEGILKNAIRHIYASYSAPQRARRRLGR